MATLKTWNGLARASVKTFDGLASASWKTWNGLSVPTTDPYFASVVLLLGNSNGTSGTSDFIDQSSAARTMTAVGNAQWTNVSPFTGLTTVPLLDGTGDRITAASSTDFAFGTGDFTVEVFTSFAAVSRVNGIWEATEGGGGGVGTPPFFYVNAANTLLWGRHNVGNDLSYAWSVAQDTEYHVAVARAGTALKMFVDGSEVASATNGNALTQLGSCTGKISAGDLSGRIVQRITKGVARYTGAFTPPTLPFPTS